VLLERGARHLETCGCTDDARWIGRARYGLPWPSIALHRRALDGEAKRCSTVDQSGPCGDRLRSVLIVWYPPRNAAVFGSVTSKRSQADKRSQLQNRWCDLHGLVRWVRFPCTSARLHDILKTADEGMFAIWSTYGPRTGCTDDTKGGSVRAANSSEGMD